MQPRERHEQMRHKPKQPPVVSPPPTATMPIETIVASPPQAAAVGYNLNTFAATFDPAQVDMNISKAQGYKFYPWTFFGNPTNTEAIVLNSDKSVLLQGDYTGPGGELATAAIVGPGNFVGTAFG